MNEPEPVAVPEGAAELLSADLGAREVIARLKLAPHPEGGHFRHARAADADGRGDPPVAVDHLLGPDDCLEWHRVLGAREDWTFLAGAPLVLTVSPNGHDASAYRMGPDPDRREIRALIVPDGHWRTAEPLGQWTLLRRTMAPGSGTLELAPPDWRPVPRAAGGGR